MRALREGVAVAPDDLDHPGYEALEALVDGTLTDVDREVIATHLEWCAQCAEDVADLKATRAALTPISATRSSGRWIKPAAAAAAIAASLLLVIWLGRARQTTVPPAQVAVAQPTAPPAASDPLTAEERATVDRALTSRRIELPASVASLTTGRGTLLGGAAPVALSPIGPVGTSVTSVRPTFSWQPVAGARSYSIAVFDDRFQEVAKGTRIASTSWTPDHDLPRDRALAWQITAHRDGSDLVGPAPPQPEARFQVIGAAAAEAVSEQRVRLANHPLELAILLGRAGLVQDAIVLLQQAGADPAGRDQARALLASLTKP